MQRVVKSYFLGSGNVPVTIYPETFSNSFQFKPQLRQISVHCGLNSFSKNNFAADTDLLHKIQVNNSKNGITQENGIPRLKTVLLKKMFS